MQALRCDRCGGFYLKGDRVVKINDAGYTLNIVQTYDSNQRPMDFCENCKKSFADWFNKTYKTEKWRKDKYKENCDVTKD